MGNFTDSYLEETEQIIKKIDRNKIEAAVDVIARVKKNGGRLFILGVGGSSASASHAVNDFRKLCGIEAYAPTDNVSELTARTNDEGWNTVFLEWLKTSKLGPKDCVFVMSVGGGDAEKNISANLVEAVKYAKKCGSAVVGIVGRDGGYTAKTADAAVIIPVVNSDMITPHTESFHSVITHLFVSHPKLKSAVTKWESTK